MKVKMKKSKEILKQAGGGFLAYIVPCLMGTYVGFYQNVDLSVTAQIAGCVILFIVIGAIVSLLKNEYDSRRYNGYVYLFSSLGLLLQIIIQGEIFDEKRIIVCVLSYIFSFIVGILILLLAKRKIVIKNKLLREIGKTACVVCGFLILFIVRVGKMFTGRRGEILYKAMEADDTIKAVWFVILVITCIYGLVSSMNITSVAIKEG